MRRVPDACAVAQVVLISWLAMRLGEVRLHIAAGAYAALAISYLIGEGAPVVHLFDEALQPYRAHRPDSANFGPEILNVLAAATAATALVRVGSATVRRMAPWAAAGLLVYAGSNGVLWLFAALAEPGTSTDTYFQNAHTAISLMWGLVGLTALTVGLRRRGADLRAGGFLLFGLALTKLLLFDLASLDAMARAVSFLALGVVFLIAAAVYQRLSQQNE